MDVYNIDFHNIHLSPTKFPTFYYTQFQPLKVMYIYLSTYLSMYVCMYICIYLPINTQTRIEILKKITKIHMQLMTEVTKQVNFVLLCLSFCSLATYQNWYMSSHSQYAVNSYTHCSIYTSFKTLIWSLIYKNIIDILLFNMFKLRFALFGNVST